MPCINWVYLDLWNIMYSSQCSGFSSLYLPLLSPGSKTCVAFVRWLHEVNSEFWVVEILSDCRSFWAVIKNDNCTSYADIWYMPHLLPGVLEPLTNLHNKPKGSKRYVATRWQNQSFKVSRKYMKMYCFENLLFFKHPLLEWLDVHFSKAENHCKASV